MVPARRFHGLGDEGLVFARQGVEQRQVRGHLVAAGRKVRPASVVEPGERALVQGGGDDQGRAIRHGSSILSSPDPINGRMAERVGADISEPRYARISALFILSRGRFLQWFCAGLGHAFGR
jgi:hypothetical protein